MLGARTLRNVLEGVSVFRRLYAGLLCLARPDSRIAREYPDVADVKNVVSGEHNVVPYRSRVLYLTIPMRLRHSSGNLGVQKHTILFDGLPKVACHIMTMASLLLRASRGVSMLQ